MGSVQVLCLSIAVTAALSTEVCHDEIQKLDIIFVLDGSYSVKNNFGDIIRWTQNMAAEFDVEAGAHQIGVIQYSDFTLRVSIENQRHIRTEVKLGRYKTNMAIKKRIANITRRAGVATYTAHAILKALSDFRAGARWEDKTTNKVMVVLTSGPASDHGDLKYITRYVRSFGIIPFAVGVGNYWETELHTIATGNQSSDFRVFKVRKFSGLDRIVQNLSSAILKRESENNSAGLCAPTYLRIESRPCSSEVTVKWRAHQRSVHINHRITFTNINNSKTVGHANVIPNNTETVTSRCVLSPWKIYEISVIPCPNFDGSCNSTHNMTGRVQAYTVGLPGKVGNLTVNRYSCLINWEKPMGVPTELIIKYKVTINESFNNTPDAIFLNGSTSVKMINNHETSLSIEGKPDFIYRIGVQAETCAGYGSVTWTNMSCITAQQIESNSWPKWIFGVISGFAVFMIVVAAMVVCFKKRMEEDTSSSRAVKMRNETTSTCSTTIQLDTRQHVYVDIKEIPEPRITLSVTNKANTESEYTYITPNYHPYEPTDGYERVFATRRASNIPGDSMLQPHGQSAHCSTDFRLAERAQGYDNVTFAHGTGDETEYESIPLTENS